MSNYTRLAFIVIVSSTNSVPKYYRSYVEENGLAKYEFTRSDCIQLLGCTELSIAFRRFLTKRFFVSRYSDGELTMTFRNGDKCSSHFHRETVINFHCDRNAG